ncbi:hypothetical protein [Thermococcus sp.]|uniref:hypothetical protein n=1 Tax=Thermococcus sp. TaxID=35749 RepID=UPI0019CAA80A|nr:hypothetical protein [Thermococcus sp.]MBC7094873.1 hypothetical protein [Thermococcus sp.]
MPSWRVHKKWSKKICGFYSEEIDKLIDNPQHHDAGRYDEKVFLEEIKQVSSKYGEKGVECYLLHHLLDKLKDELVGMKSRYGKIDLNHIQEILLWLKPEPMYKIGQYNNIWNSLLARVKMELKEIVDDITSENGFKKSSARAVINKWVSNSVKLVLELLPPCILIDSIDRAIIHSRVTKLIWSAIRSQEDVTPEKIELFIRQCIGDYITEKGLYREKLCPRKCKPRAWEEENWEHFLKSLKIPCPKIKM